MPVLAGSDISKSADDATRTYCALINAYTHGALAATLFKAEDDLREGHRYSGAFLVSHINGGVAGIANMASAVNLNPDGLGQVLLYPYYTVNGHQQTLLSVVNTDTVNGKAVKVRFLEGYNSREVLDFNLFLSPADVWTANVFALADAGISGDGAAIFTTDKTCTAPSFTEGPLSNGSSYQHFLNYAYSGTNSDTGPTTDDRTREGHFEMIEMSDIVGGALLGDIKHVNGVPPGCSKAEAAFEAGTTTAIGSGAPDRRQCR